MLSGTFWEDLYPGILVEGVLWFAELHPFFDYRLREQPEQ